ncbi:hypothetical protein [Pedobacter sp. SYSU D00535]|uniref:hypothetical protein n=1 Tax=Pedobacter sp. SYSU D00535 TaxID=2810308 RepID=UPI001A9706EC|nr:hypothetical protein [Pedobacter sp. SYSU D00535]
MKRIFVSLTFLVAFALACFAADITGNWKGVVKTPDGDDLEITYHLKANGDNLTGKLSTSIGELELIDGRIKGDEFDFKLKLGSVVMENQGRMFSDSLVIVTLVQGDTLQHTFKRIRQ